eukprot:scaffold4913_cov111-Isochrysis_galbana.AAC.6
MRCSRYVTKCQTRFGRFQVYGVRVIDHAKRKTGCRGHGHKLGRRGATYANAGGKTLARTMAECGGMIDAFRLASARGHKIGLFTPRTHYSH